MKIDYLYEKIRKNISTVKLKDTFTSEQDLYNVLGLPKEKGNKQNKRAAAAFLKWKKTTPKCRQIVIASIVEDPMSVCCPKDRRANNGGKYEGTYSPIIKDAILTYGKRFEGPLTLNEICQEVLGFPKELFTKGSYSFLGIPKDNEMCNSYVKELLYEKLRKSTKRSLSRLKTEGRILYKKVYRILSHYPDSCFVPRTIDINSSTTLDYFLDIVLQDAITYYNSIGKDILKEIEDVINKAIKRKRHVSIYNIKLDSFLCDNIYNDARDEAVLMCVKYRHAYLRKIKKYNDKQEVWTAGNSEKAFIKQVEKLIQEKMGISSKRMAMQSDERALVYWGCQNAYDFLEWYNVWTAYDIRVLKPIKKAKYYKAGVYKKLLAILEPSMVKWCMKEIPYNWNVPSHLRKGVGGLVEIVRQHPYAFSCCVVRMHCRIFGIEGGDDYLLLSCPDAKKAIAKDATNYDKFIDLMIDK